MPKKGERCPDHVRQAVGEANRQRVISEDTRRKLSESRRGERNHLFGKHLSEETKVKLRQVMRGRPLSEEHKRKLSEGSKRSWQSSERRKALSKRMHGNQHNIGYKHTPEARQNMAKAQHRNAQDPVRNARISESLRGNQRARGYRHSEETRKRISNSLKGLLLGPKSSQWRGGIAFFPYGPEFTLQCRESIRQRDGGACRLCGAFPSRHVHHIDYDKKNNDTTNLMLLCHACHSRTISHRDSWMNFLQEMMRSGRQPLLDAT